MSLSLPVCISLYLSVCPSPTLCSHLKMLQLLLHSVQLLGLSVQLIVELPHSIQLGQDAASLLPGTWGEIEIREN